LPFHTYAPAKELGAIADRFAVYRNVPLVMVGMGWHDILTMALFRSKSDMRLFVGKEVGMIPGIKSVEVLTMTEAFRPMPQVVPPAQAKKRTGVPAVDQVDLMILSEIERDGRLPAAHIARKLGMDRGIVSARLKRILDEKIVTIAVMDNTRGSGWQIPAVIALRVSPTEIQSAVREVGKLSRPECFVRVVGIHDLVIGATFLDSRDFLETLRGLRRQLLGIPGVVSVDIMIGLELRKMAYDNLATPLLDSPENGRRKM
jgi:DNA-binding Lrp family transcriptional regulator